MSRLVVQLIRETSQYAIADRLPRVRAVDLRLGSRVAMTPSRRHGSRITTRRSVASLT
jgi:hypothetical protein